MAGDNAYIGSRIRELRKGKNLTQTELASKLNLSQQTLSRYENGSTQIPYAELLNLVEFFKTPIEYFFGMDIQKVSEDEIRLVAYYRSLNSNMQCKALNIVKLLSDDSEACETE